MPLLSDIGNILDSPGRASRSALMALLGSGNAPVTTQGGVGDALAQEYESQPYPRRPGGSVMPLLAGLAAGGVTSLLPGGALLAPFVGSGAMGLSQGLSEAIVPDETGSFSSADVNARLADITGIESLRDNYLADFATQIATDPMSYVGAMQAKRMMSPDPRLMARLDKMKAYEKAIPHGPLPQTVPGVPGPYTPMGSIPPKGFIPTPMEAELLPGYNASQLQTLGFDMADIVPSGIARAKPYKQINQEVSPLMQYLGFSDEAGQMAGALPPWAQVRGGRVMPNPEMEQQILNLKDMAGLSGYEPGASVQRAISRMKGLM